MLSTNDKQEQWDIAVDSPAFSQVASRKWGARTTNRDAMRYCKSMITINGQSIGNVPMYLGSLNNQPRWKINCLYGYQHKAMIYNSLVGRWYAIARCVRNIYIIHVSLLKMKMLLNMRWLYVPNSENLRKMIPHEELDSIVVGHRARKRWLNLYKENSIWPQMD